LNTAQLTMTLEEYSEEQSDRAWHGHRDRQLKELGIDLEELDDD